MPVLRRRICSFGYQMFDLNSGSICHLFKRIVIATTIPNIDDNKFDVFSQLGSA